MAINSVTITGNLTRDCELKSTQSGLSVIVFCVAVNERRKNRKTGSYEDYPHFIDCKMFGPRAESLQPYLSKGSKVTVSGHLDQSRWTKDGVRKSRVEVVCDDIDLAQQKTEAGIGAEAPYSAYE